MIKTQKIPKHRLLMYAFIALAILAAFSYKLLSSNKETTEIEIPLEWLA